MEIERIETLFANKDRFSGDAKVLYENFKYFIETKIPQIFVISSNYSMQNEISQFFDKNNETYEVKFINSEEDSNTLEQAKNQLIFSDCIIVYTSALKISPNDLYELCKFASEFNKKFYFLIGGWNTIQRTEQKVIEKLNLISELMPFVDLAKAIAVYKKEDCTNLHNYEFGVNEVINLLGLKYETLRHDQEESIFNYSRKIVSKELKNLDKSYSKQLIAISELQTYTYSKMNSFEIIMRNSTIDFTDLANQLHIFFKERIPCNYLSYYELTDFEPGKYSICIKKIKDTIKKKLDGFFGDIKKVPKIDLSNKIESIKIDCLKDMNYAFVEFSKVPDISEENLDTLKELIDSVSSFDNFKKEMESSFINEIDEIQKLVEDKLNNISIDFSAEARREAAMKVIGSLKQSLLSLKDEDEEENTSDNECDEDTDDNESSKEITEYSESGVTYDEQRKEVNAQNLCDAVIDSIKITMTGSMDFLIHESNERMKRIAKTYVDNYFLKILNKIEEINEQLSSLQKDSRINV